MQCAIIFDPSLMVISYDPCFMIVLRWFITGAYNSYTKIFRMIEHSKHIKVAIGFHTCMYAFIFSVVN